MKLALRRLLHNLSALTDVGADIGSSGNFEDVIRSSLHTLLGTLAIPRGAIAQYVSRPRCLKIVASKGVGAAPESRIVIGSDQLRELRGKKRAIVLPPDDQTASELAASIGLLRKLRVRVIVPMTVRGNLIGAVFLSDKFTGDAYNQDDLEIIHAISHHIAMAFFNHSLLMSLKRKAEDNRRLYREMRQIYQDTVKAFGRAIDLKDTYTSGHSDRVARYARAIAREMGINGKELENISVAGYLHDIGKIVVDRSIINNPRPLTEREFNELNRHVTTGYEILSHISHPWKEIAYMTKCHHEKVDGTGYPQGLSGDDIPLGSKIVTLADSFDAMMTDRPYRSRLSIDRALGDLRTNAGSQFDVTVVTAFCRLLLKEITNEVKDRVLMPMIGAKFDRQAVAEKLSSIIQELEGASNDPRLTRAAS